MILDLRHGVETDDQFRNDKIVYRRYAGLFFCVCVDSNDNELAYLEAIHLFVEILGASPSGHRTTLLIPRRCFLPECVRAGPGVLVLQGPSSTTLSLRASALMALCCLC